MAKRFIANGAFIRLEVNGTQVALCSGASFNEDFNVQPVETLNVLGPVQYDSTGYSCSVDINLFVFRDKRFIDSFIDGQRFIPLRKEVSAEGSMPDRRLSFLDRVDNKTHNTFEGCVLNTHRSDINPNSYVQRSLSFLSRARVK